jgi:hypothetical protein
MADGSDAIDWRLTTWEGSRREQLRRWAALPLVRVIAALEEMEAVSLMLHPRTTTGTRAATVREGSRPPAPDA